MKKLSNTKWSLLGLLLLAASAVTAAVMPAQKEKKVSADGNGWLEELDEFNGVDQRTCISTNAIGDCHETTSNGQNPDSATTNNGPQSSEDDDVDLDDNTTDD